MKSSVLMSGDAVRLGSPELSPVKDGSKAKATNPRSAIFIAYRPELCSFVAPKGPDTAIAGNNPSPALPSRAGVMPFGV